MATNYANLSPEIKELVINNFQQKFPSLCDRNIISRVLDNERWDFERGYQVLEKLNSEFSKPSSNNDEKTKTNNSQSTNKNRSKRNKAKDNNNKPEKISPISSGCAQSGIGANTTVPQVFLDPKLKQPSKPLQQESAFNKVSKAPSKTEIKKSYDIVKQLKDPFDRIVAYTRLKIKVMVFMRGCSGSGKSTYARELLSKIGINSHKWYIFSADDYFIDESSGVYKYNSDFIASAHEWNQNLVKQAALEGRSPIIIDNTHTRLWEMKDNSIVGVENGYIIETLEPKTPWFFVEAQLCRKSCHNVSRETIQRMLDRYEANITGTDIVTKLRLIYKCVPPNKQNGELELPPSKKSLKLYSDKSNKFSKTSSKVDINHEENLRKLNHYRMNSQPFSDNSTFIPVNQSQFRTDSGITYSGSPSPFIQTTVPKIPPPSRWINHDNFRPPIDESITNFTHTISSSFVPTTMLPSALHNPHPTLLTPSSFVGSNTLDSSHLYNEKLDKTKSNVTSDPLTPVDFDKFNEAQDLNCASPLPGTSPAENLSQHYYFEKLTFLLDNNITKNEDVRTEKEDENANYDNSENTKHSDSSSVTSFGLDYKLKEAPKIANEEYVLIMPDQTIRYQQEHVDAPKTLSEFVSNYNNEGRQSFIKMNTVKASDAVSGQDRKIPLLWNGVNIDFLNNCAIDRPKVSVDVNVFNKGSTGKDNALQGIDIPSININQNNLNVDTASSFNNGASANRIEPDTNAVSKYSDASSNTHYTDFDMLKVINSLEDATNIENVLIGNPMFESGPFVIKTEPSISSVLMLDKSSMTHEIQTNLVNSSLAIDSLMQMFPSIKKENLEELLCKCSNDLDWAVGLLLDSGHEMCEYNGPELTVLNDNHNQDDASIINDEIDVNCPSTSNGITHIGKKKKKNNVNLSEDTKGILQNFQDKFQLKDEHYSEHVGKIRKLKMGIVDDNQNASVPSETREESPEEGEEEEDEEKDSEVALILDKPLVLQLQDKFGGLLSSNLIRK